MSSIQVRIDEYLLGSAAPQTARQIATGIGAELSTVKSSLSRHRGLLWSQIGENRNSKWAILDPTRKQARKETVMVRGVVRLHRNGEKFAISTNAETERDFLDGLASALAGEDSSFEVCCNSAVMARWLSLGIDVACKLRGYKSDAVEKRVIMAGAWMPDNDDSVVAVAGELSDVAVAHG